MANEHKNKATGVTTLLTTLYLCRRRVCRFVRGVLLVEVPFVILVGGSIELSYDGFIVLQIKIRNLW